MSDRPLANLWDAHKQQVAEAAGVSIEDTQKALGHADVRTTQRFCTKSEADRTRGTVLAIDSHLRDGYDLNVGRPTRRKSLSGNSSVGRASASQLLSGLRFFSPSTPTIPSSPDTHVDTWGCLSLRRLHSPAHFPRPG